MRSGFGFLKRCEENKYVNGGSKQDEIIKQTMYDDGS